jgi:predicted secreted protein
MSTSVAGRKSSILVSTTVGGSYSQVQGVKSITHTLNGTMVDDSEMGVNWNQRIQGLKDCKVSFTGGRRSADTNGQEIIKTAFLNDTDLYVQVLWDGTNGYQFYGKVSKFEVQTSVEGKAELSCDIEGSGAVTAKP